MSELLQIIQKLLKTSPRAARRVEQFADEVPRATEQFSPNAISEAAQDLRIPISPLKPNLFGRYASPFPEAYERDIRSGRADNWNELKELMANGRPQFDDLPMLAVGQAKDSTVPQIFMHDGRHRMGLLDKQFDTSATQVAVSSSVLGENKLSPEEQLDAAIEWLNKQKNVLNERTEARPHPELQPNVFKPFADGGLAHFKDGGRAWTDEEIASMTHERPTEAVPNFSDAARAIKDIVADHYKRQATGLLTDPLGTASRNVRTATELALPVSTLYKAADVATDAPGAEPPDAWDVVGDVGALTGYKVGRDVLKAAAPAAVAGLALMPADAEASPLKDALKAGRAAVDARLPKGTFSPAARAIESAPQDMTGNQWKNFLRGRQVDVAGQKFPVRPDELEFTEMGKLLEQYGDKPVSRGALLDYLGAKKPKSAYDPELEQLYATAARRGLSDAENARLAQLQEAASPGAPHEAYRGATYPEQRTLGANPKFDGPGGYQTQYEEHQLPGPRERYTEEVTRMPDLDYKATHFGPHSRGLISHSRMSTRELPEGGKAVHIDEIQSDLHQKARDAGGYRGSPAETQELMEFRKLKSLFDEGSLTPEQESRYISLAERVAPRSMNDPSLPPRAPYADRYHEVEFNKALRRAVDEDADRVTWTTGDQQAQRWNQQIEGGVKKLELVPDENAPGTHVLNVIDKKGRPVTFYSDVDGKFYHNQAGEGESYTLQDLLGNSLAKKLKDQGTLEGDNLSLGGGGFKNFYDGTINKYADSWARRFPGAKVEGTELSGQSKASFSAADLSEKFQNIDDLGYLAPDRGAVSAFLTEARRHQAFDELPDGVVERLVDRVQAAHRAAGISESRNDAAQIARVAFDNAKKFVGELGNHQVHSLRLTPEMKAWVKQHGTPIMSVAPAAAALPALNAPADEGMADGGTVLSRIEEMLR